MRTSVAHPGANTRLFYMLSNHPNILGGNGGGVSSTVIGGIGLFADGTAAAPSISFLSNQTTGIYRPSSGVVGVAADGFAVARIGRLSAGVGFVQAGGSSGGYVSLADAGAVGLVALGTNQNITLTPSGNGTTANLGGGYFTGSGVMPNGSAGGVEITGSNTAGNVFAFRRGTGAIPLVLQGAGGNALVGTATDSGALLQIGTNTTTSAGGLVFGTDNFLYRSSSTSTTLSNAGAANTLYLNISGANKSSFGSDGTGTYIGCQQSGGSLFLLSSAGTTAVTIDSSLNVAFSGTAITLASSSAKCGFRIPSGAAPSSPTTGDLWYDGTNLKFRDGGTTRTITWV